MKNLNNINSSFQSTMIPLIFVACLAILPLSRVTAQAVDEDIVIVANGNILTMNSDQPTASAMAIKNGKILAVGDLAAVKQVAGDSYEYIDLEGKTVTLGFIESHDHLALYGGTLAFLNIIPYAIHNDPPVSPPNAIQALWIAVNRLTSSGKVLGPDERITPEQALMAYTKEAAIVLGIEDYVGTLEPGKYADFVVLSDNPLEVDPMAIKDIFVDATVMNGEITYLATLGFSHH